MYHVIVRTVGYDGSYRSDFHEFHVINKTWTQITSFSGRAPKPRYRGTCCVLDDNMYLFGGHDGSRHLNDVFVFNFVQQVYL